ncbi:hypothetical protein HDU67_000907 [Dinochytrium kinnereticum]|nr:hypothetical protein HDU67_000907 [Dinochytrium kinnereticum]
MSVLFQDQQEDLQFSSYSYGDQQQASGYAARPGPAYQPASSYSSNYGQQPSISWSAAFSTGGFADEPPLLEELGVNFSHIVSKAMAVLNPFRSLDKNIMDDTDLAGPLIFCFLFGGFLLFSGKVHFGYIYGIAMLGWGSMYTILNLMSDQGVDGYRTASVLGYCLLPMVVLGFLSSILVPLSGVIALWILSALSVLWCTHSASLMFVTVLSLNEQRLLVAYPVFLLYSAFALLAVF